MTIPFRRGLALGIVTATLASRAQSLDLQPKIDPLARPLVENGVAVGFVVGILKDGETQILAYGETERGSGVKPTGDTVYEIGSVTKTFTGVILAHMSLRGLVELDDPVQKYLPPSVRVPVAEEQPITLAHLATHTSGLPRMPDNFEPAAPSDPYADYTVERMYAFLGAHRLRRPPGRYEYSNYAAGLLGHVLARRAQTSYEQLVELVSKPLGMSSTRITLNRKLRRRLAPPYNSELKPDHAWSFRALAGAGAIRSTVSDLLKFLKANVSRNDDTLGKAIRLSHEKRHSMKDGQAVGLGWHIAADGITRVHSGMTGGYHAWLAVAPSPGIGVVVLSNTATGRISQFGEQVTRVAFGIDVKPLPTRKAIDVPPAVLRAYAGLYRITPQFALNVTVEDGKLMVQATGQPKLQVFAESKTKFFYKAVDAQLTFTVNKDGRATKLTLHQGGRDVEAARQ